MKTSNRLLLGLLSAIVLYFTAAFVELRVKGDYNRTSYNTDSVSLPVFRHLVIKGLDQRVNIERSDAPMVTSRTVRENSLDAIDFEVNGDTLIINDLGLQNNDEGLFTIHTGTDIRSLVSIESYYRLENLRPDSLTIRQEGGRGAIYNCRSLVHMDLNVGQAGQFNTWDTPLESVHLQMINGHVELRSPVNTLYGSMEDNSYLNLSGVLDFNFKRDNSSRLRHFQ